MNSVVWRKLALAGFGCHARPLSLALGEGLNVLAAPNEAGKSTLVAGLEAVLFGLPNASDPADFGTARFRPRAGAESLEGTVEFTADGREYRAWRDFRTNRISLQEQGEDGGWRELAGGEHNPQARRRNARYEEVLAGLLGITGRALFEATFCLAQPLPEGEALGQDVQRLLSGAGGTYERALQSLEKDLKGITRCNGDLGVGNNGRKDARLEEMRRELSVLEEAAAGAREQVDGLEALRREAKEAESRLRELREEAGRQREALNAWSEWRACQQRYGTALSQQRALDEARRQADALAQRREEYRRELRRRFPDLAGAGEEDGAPLERVVAERQAAWRELEQRGSKVQEMEAELEHRFEDLRELPPGAGAAASARPAAARRLQQAEAAARRSGQRRWGGAAAGALLGALLLPALGLYGVAAMLALAAAGWWLGGRAGSAGQVELEEARRELQRLDGQLGGWAGADAAALGALAQRLRDRESALRRHREALAGLPPAAAEEEARRALAEAVERWETWRGEQAGLRELTRELQGLLRGQQASSADELAGRALDAANQAVAARTAWDDLCRRHPGLPQQGEDALAAEESYRKLAVRVQGLEVRERELEEQGRDTLRRLAQLEGVAPLNLAQAEERLAELRDGTGSLQEESRALALAWTLLQEAARGFHATHRQRLGEAAGGYFRSFTGRTDRRLELDEGFQVNLFEGGQPLHTRQLSRGARDQLFLSLRLAVADLLAGGLRLPLILDDPFLNCDAERLLRIRQALTNLAGERQIWLLSHRPDFLAWGQPVEWERAGEEEAR